MLYVKSGGNSEKACLTYELGVVYFGYLTKQMIFGLKLKTKYVYL